MTNATAQSVRICKLGPASAGIAAAIWVMPAGTAIDAPVRVPLSRVGTTTADAAKEAEPGSAGSSVPVAGGRALASGGGDDGRRGADAYRATTCRSFVGPHGNVDICNVAVFDEPGIVELELAGENLGDHRVRARRDEGAMGESARPVVEVTADRLDTLQDLAALDHPIGVKIDTQGAECQVFAGGRSVLARAAAIAFEFWPYGMARMNGDVAFLTQFLAAHFSAGAIVSGDKNETPRWQSIDVVVARLVDLATREHESPLRYYDVIVQKA